MQEGHRVFSEELYRIASKGYGYFIEERGGILTKGNKMFVYVMRSKKNADGPIKIGKAKDPTKRLKVLQTGNHEKLAIIHLVKCKSDMNASFIEREFHRKLKRLKINGEWFKPDALGVFRKLMGEMQFQNRRRYEPAIKGCWTL